jgi:hypothetical protein
MLLNKTEQALVNRARESAHNRAGVQIGYRTGRKGSFYGSRESAALGKLVGKGIARIVSQQRYVDSHNRYSDHWTETIYELTDGASSDH